MPEDLSKFNPELQRILRIEEDVRRKFNPGYDPNNPVPRKTFKVQVGQTLKQAMRSFYARNPEQRTRHLPKSKSALNRKQRRHKSRKDKQLAQAKSLKHCFWIDDRNRVDAMPVPEYTHHPSVTETKVLSVHNEFIQAQAKFEKRDNLWLCVEAPKPIQWMKGKMDMGLIKNQLLKMGCEWRWM